MKIDRVRYNEQIKKGKSSTILFSIVSKTTQKGFVPKIFPLLPEFLLFLLSKNIESIASFRRVTNLFRTAPKII